MRNLLIVSALAAAALVTACKTGPDPDPAPAAGPASTGPAPGTTYGTTPFLPGNLMPENPVPIPLI